MLKIRKEIRDSAKAYIHDIAVDYSANKMGFVKSDGQMVSNYLDLLNVARDRHEDNNDKQTWELLYIHCFPSGWQIDVETNYMHNKGVVYRKWTNSKRVRSGFIAKIHTSELSKFRKKFDWLIWKQKAEVDDKGKKIRRRYTGREAFVPEIHVVNYDGKKIYIYKHKQYN